MGSTGSGAFTDYSKRMPDNSEDKTGGSEGVDKCGKAFSTKLEEVSRCFYFLSHKIVPPIKSNIYVVFNGKRIAVENESGEEIGYLPTKYNYIKFCIDEKFKYSGVITHSSLSPIPTVTVDIAPN